MRSLLRALALCAGALGLAACAVPPEYTGPVKSMSMLAGQITANSPAGYCVDPQASKPRKGFAVMGPCSSMGTDDASPDVLGVATVQVGPSDSGIVLGGEAALDTFLQTEAGAALLSREGDPDLVEVITTKTEEEAVIVHFSDRSAPFANGLEAAEWRAFTDIDGRLVTVAVRGLAEAPLRDDTGPWLLNLVMTGLLGSGDNAPQAEQEGGLVSFFTNIRDSFRNETTK